jgi:site-specific DNA-methyltransferase (adenine-specific)
LNPALFSSNKQDWETPQKLFDELNEEFQFERDVAANEQNAKCAKFFTEADDGLKQDWSKDVCWLNPPYGRAIASWLRKAYEESKKGATVVCLVAARTDTRWWHEYALKASEIRYLKGRLRFVGAKDSAPFPSAILVFRPPARPVPTQKSRTKAIVGQSPAPKAGKYQFFSDLTADEFNSLKASIAERGVEVPAIVDQNGETIDGFHRQRACDELKMHCLKEVREFASKAERYETALRLNCRRRQLTRRQKKDLIGAYLKRDPAMADNHLAEIIGGVSKNTVSEVRRRLERTRQIDKLKVLRGKDGKERPKKYKKIIANTPNEAETAFKVIAKLPESCAGKTLDLTTAKRRARRQGHKQQRAERIVEPVGDDDVRLVHCRFQDLDVEPESANLVLTDIPYGRDFLPQVAELGEFAAKVLVPNSGLLVTYCGHFCLPKVLNALGENLTYRWTNASVWDGDGNDIFLGKGAVVVSHWKPIVVFSKGDLPARGWWHDVFRFNAKEKEYHPWQQGLAEVSSLVERFSDPGDLVIDPCAESFTTAVACHRLNRRFIGCDVERECVEVGHKRLAQEIQRKETNAQSIAHSA